MGKMQYLMQLSVVSDRTGLKIPIDLKDLPEETGIVYVGMPVSYEIDKVEEKMLKKSKELFDGILKTYEVDPKMWGWRFWKKENK